MKIFAGTCAVESYDICVKVANHMQEISLRLGLDFTFKASFDKANRTSGESFRGLYNALEVLQKVKQVTGAKIVTDVHEPHQCPEVAEVADIIQIPAFLCRQTDLIRAAAKTGKEINIKKGQFMAAEDMGYAVEKVRQFSDKTVYLTERGTTFGYHDLVVDFRSIPIMQQFAPVIFDVTHSVQQPGGKNGSSGGQRQYALTLAKAANGAGVDGFFIETHPDPSKALSDKETQMPLSEMEGFLKMVLNA